MPVYGSELVAKNIRQYGGGFLRSVNSVMKKVEFMLDKQLEKNISRSDFTLQELADMDHPFARRHGSDKGTPVYSPYWMVHKRTGQLLQSKESGTLPAGVSGGNLKATAFVMLNPAIAKHALYVVYGTSKMIPRPVVTGSGEQVADKAFKLLKETLKKLTFAYRAR